MGLDTTRSPPPSPAARPSPRSSSGWATPCVARVDAYEGKTVVIACHGGVIDAVLRLALKSPAMGAFEIHTLNTSITELSWSSATRGGSMRYNDSAHLAGLPAHTNQD